MLFDKAAGLPNRGMRAAHEPGSGEPETAEKHPTSRTTPSPCETRTSMTWWRGPESSIGELVRPPALS